MTNSDLITGALRLLGVLNEVQVASAEQGTQGLEVLNQIMSDWEADGVDLQYYEQVDLSAETPVPTHAIAGVKHFLAFALAPEYGRSVSREMLAAGDKFYSRITRDAVIQGMSKTKLEDMPRNTTFSKILTG